MFSLVTLVTHLAHFFIVIHKLLYIHAHACTYTRTHKHAHTHTHGCTHADKHFLCIMLTSIVCRACHLSGTFVLLVAYTRTRILRAVCTHQPFSNYHTLSKTAILCSRHVAVKRSLPVLDFTPILPRMICRSRFLLHADSRPCEAWRVTASCKNQTRPTSISVVV